MCHHKNSPEPKATRLDDEYPKCLEIIQVSWHQVYKDACKVSEQSNTSKHKDLGRQAS